MAEYTHILYEKTGHIARVKTNRPRYRNAQSRVMLEELDDAFAVATDDHDVRVIILSGEGDHFSGGHDLGTPEEQEDEARRPYPAGTAGVFKKQWDLFMDPGLRWRDIPKPTIAQVHGYCIFGGWLIASAMDLVVASEDALFLPGHVQYFTLPWDVGIRKTKEMLFKGHFIPAREALELGFVNQVVPRDALESTTQKLAEDIAENDPLRMRMTKLSVNQTREAMGFRASVHSAFSNFMVMAMDGSVRREQDRKAGKRSLGPVDHAMKKLKESQQ